MILNTLKCNHLTPLGLKGLMKRYHVTQILSMDGQMAGRLDNVKT